MFAKKKNKLKGNIVQIQFLNNKKQEELEIELSGHTDNVGNPKLNKKLSMEKIWARHVDR